MFNAFHDRLTSAQLQLLFAGLRIVEAIVLGQEVMPMADWEVNPCVDNDRSDSEMMVLTHHDEQVARVLKETVSSMSVGVTILRCLDHAGVHVWPATTIAKRQQKTTEQ